MHPLKRFMRERHLRARWLADKIGTSPSYISQIISGHRRPSGLMALAIEEATSGEVKVGDLLRFTPPEAPPATQAA